MKMTRIGLALVAAAAMFSTPLAYGEETSGAAQACDKTKAEACDKVAECPKAAAIAGDKVKACDKVKAEACDKAGKPACGKQAKPASACGAAKTCGK